MMAMRYGDAIITSAAPAVRRRALSLCGGSSTMSWWLCLTTLTRMPRPASCATRYSSSVVLPLPDQPITPSTGAPFTSLRDTSVGNTLISDTIAHPAEIQDSRVGQQFFQHQSGRHFLAFVAQALVDQYQAVGRIGR